MKLHHVTIRTRDLQATRSFFLLESSPQVRTRQRWERMMSRTVTELLVGVLEQVRAIKHTDIEDRTSTETTTSARMGVGSWIILIVLLSLLVATGVVIYLGWTLGNGTDVSTSSYVAMVLGVVISLAVGFGFMVLLFYSSRKGYDEPPVMIVPENDSTESKDVPGTK